MCKYTFSLIFLSLLIGLSSCKKPIDQKDTTTQKNWEIGPFVKQDAENPILVPNSELVFIDPVSGEETAFEGRNVLNPSAVVKDGKVHSSTGLKTKK